MILAGSESDEGNIYQTIELSGNNLLTETEYLKYTGLNDSAIYNEISLADVKSKLEDHPYVIKADVRFDGINAILVELVEKNPKACVLNKNKFSLITEHGDLLPVFNQNLVASLPIISNLKNIDQLPPSKAEVKAAFKIIDVIELVDEKMYRSLAEINLRKGGDILILFAGIKFPVVFGKNCETKKIIALKSIWDSIINEKNSALRIEYIDLRYRNKIFIGKRKPTRIAG